MEQYQVINTVLRMFRLKNLVCPLCEIAGVSRSAYYHWLKRVEKDSLREERNYADYILLKLLHDRRHGKIGYRGFYMEVIELIGSLMNHKRTLRLMRKYGIVMKIRTKSAYRKLTMASRQIVAHHMSTSLHRTRKLEEYLHGDLHPEAMIHSDQGFYYTHAAYQSWIYGMGIAQSMSRRGNCLDNAFL